MKRAFLLAAVTLLAGCVAPSPEAMGSPAPSPSASSTPRVEPTATASLTPTATPLPSPTGEVQRTGIRTNPLGRLSGNWIFVGKQVPGPHGITAEVQIWAIPLDGGNPKFAFGYDVSLGGAPEAIFDNTPYLRRQFSPDGTRVVVSAGGQLVVVDLPTGRVTPLGTQGFYPAWSKDGSRIAFLYELPVDQVVPPEEAIGVIPATGGPVRELAKVGYSRQSVEWSPTGSMVMVAEPDRTTIIETATGNLVRVIPEMAARGSSFAHWRLTGPQVVLAVGTCDRTNTKIVTMADANQPSVTQLDTGKRCPDLSIRDPRWSPVGTSELLYLATRAAPGLMPSEYRAHVLNTFSGTDVTLPFSPYEATWTWDGAQIAYIASGPAFGFGNSIRLWRRDGTGERELMRGADGEPFFSLASLSY